MEQPVSFSQAAESAEASSPLNGYGLFNLGSGSSQQVGKTAAPLMLPLTLNGTQVEMELDTGAAVSLMTKQQWDRLPTRSALAHSTVTLRTYTGEHVHVHDEATVRVGYAGQEHTLSLVVVDGKGPALFGRNWLQTIKLNWAEIKSLATEARNSDLTARYPEVFAEGLGTMSTTAKLQVSHDAQPKFFKPRPVPYALRPAVSDKLDRLEAAGILEQVPFSDWATPIVCVRKSNGSVRLCGDYKVTINPALSVDQHPLPRPEELLHSLAGGTVFSVLDMTNAYQQMKLAEDSRVFTTINTDRGLYRYTRLPFGIASTPAIFQRAMDQITQGLRGVVVYIDDILVTGRTQAEHDNNLNALMQRLRENGVRLRREKCKLNQSSVEYLGFRIDADGVHVATSKVAAVLQAPVPKDASQLRSFLGLINYHARFIKNLSTMLHPLYVLLKHDTPWKWSEHCQEAFNAAKNALESPDVLAHYDPKLPVRLATDASPYGVGAVLMHVTPDGLERPVAFASRALSRSEQNYSQLDREALGIIFGVKKFHTYLFGRRFTLITDHKPLTSIFSPTKGTPSMAAARLQRWSIVLASYDYDIEYRSSANNASADAMSRLPLAQEDADSFVTEEEIFHTPVESTLPVTAIQLGTATQHDPILAQVHRWTRSGWPSTLPNEMFQPYKVRQHDNSTDGACLLWGARVVVPAVLRADVLQMLHEQHPGMCRMKAIARSHVWWPSLDTAIEEQVRSCSPCQLAQREPAKAPLSPWEHPARPWQRLHIDYAELDGQSFFLLVDAYSKWPEIVPMTKTTSATITALRHIFSMHGLPEAIVSDNGPQFTSGEFSTFLAENGIRHIRSSPFHPASNGAAERLVQSFKSAMKKNATSQSIAHKVAAFLLLYRSTPHATTARSPSELLMSRSLRTRMDLLHPQLRQNVERQQDRQRSSHDQHARVCAPFTVGQPVLARDYRPTSKSKWQPATVTEILGPLTYRVQLTNVDAALTWKRHQDQLLARTPSAAVAPPRSDPEPKVDGVPVPVVAPSLPAVSPPTPARSAETALPLPPSPHDQEMEDKTPLLRRSSRVSKAPDRLNL